MTVRRGSSVALALIGLTAVGTASAIDPTLQVVSGTSAAETRRSVALTSARYDVANRQVVATTRAGNFVCNAPASPGSGALKLRLDGVNYQIATSALPGNLAAPIEYLPSTVTFALGLLNANLPASCVSSHTTSTNLGLKFGDQRRLAVAESVFFDLPTRAFQIRVAEPVLCHSYVPQSGSSGLAVRLNDSNSPLFSLGTSQALPGFLAVNYGLGGFTLVPAPIGGDLTPGVQCSVPDSPVSPTQGGGGGGGSSIFNSGFEPLSPLDNPSDVVVSIDGIGSGAANNNQRQVGALPGGALQYTVRVVNEGSTAAGNVQFREFVTGPNAIAQASQPQPAQTLNGEPGSSTCTPIGGGSCPVFGFPISVNLGTLAPGAGVEFTLTRVVSPSAVTGQRAQLGYAAFVDPNAAGPDTNLSNNGSWLAANLISNQAPVIAAITDQSMQEDDAPHTVQLTITDPEGNPIQTPQVTSNNSTLFPPGSLQITGSSSPYTLTLTPAAHKNGVATVQVSASDGNSAPTVRNFQMTVNAVNDAPLFTLNVSGGEIVVLEGASGCDTAQCVASALNFVTGLAPGPAGADDESAQTVRPTTETDIFGDQRLLVSACQPAAVDGVAPALFFAAAQMPRIIEPTPGNFNLIGLLTRLPGAVDCAITVVDNGSPAATSAPQNLRIRYAAL